VAEREESPAEYIGRVYAEQGMPGVQAAFRARLDANADVLLARVRAAGLLEGADALHRMVDHLLTAGVLPQHLAPARAEVTRLLAAAGQAPAVSETRPTGAAGAGAGTGTRGDGQAPAPQPETAPDFFQSGRTYLRRRWHFQCLAIAPSPFNGEVRAVGWLFREGEPATATALNPDDWAHGEWAAAPAAAPGTPDAALRTRVAELTHALASVTHQSRSSQRCATCGHIGRAHTVPAPHRCFASGSECPCTAFQQPCVWPAQPCVCPDFVRALGKDTGDRAQRPAGESTQPDTCDRCHQPFDPTDTRFDGHARHTETPWCRHCVDNCHESTDAFHKCAVCTPKEN
jgi:hypothetical protein